MFICQICEKSENPNIPVNYVTTKTRSKDYLDKNGEIIGWGHEIVEQIKVCKKCYVKAEDIEVKEEISTSTFDEVKLRDVYEL